MTHAKLAAGALDNLDQMKLHAGHVLNALDPSIQTKGPMQWTDEAIATAQKVRAATSAAEAAPLVKELDGANQRGDRR